MDRLWNVGAFKQGEFARLHVRIMEKAVELEGGGSMMPQWESQALALITGAGVEIEDAPWVLECIQKAADDIEEMDDDLRFPLYMEYHANDKIALCNLDAEAFADVLACLGVDLHRLESLWERKHLDTPTDEVDWSLE
jgi:hypothetical protein